DQVEATTATRAVVSHIRRIQPDVVVTFGPEGAYGHPDHIAISQFTAAATVCAANCGFRVDNGSQPDSSAVHCVRKLYYLAWRSNKWDAYQSAFRRLTSMVDENWKPIFLKGYGEQPCLRLFGSKHPAPPDS